MGYLTNKKLIGGMIGSEGYAEQDCASIKYLFEYFSDNFVEISFETQDDFCIVLKDKKLYVQVKVNLLTIKFVREIINGNYREKSVLIGSGYDDEFRNLKNRRERYFEAIDGNLLDEKENLYNEIDDLCKKSKINTDDFLNYEFAAIENENRIDLAKRSIDAWAQKKSKYINTDEVFNYLCMLISDKLRPVGGKLVKSDIDKIIDFGSCSKIEMFVHKKDSISDVIQSDVKRQMVEILDELIVENEDKFGDELTQIKCFLQNDQIVELKNRLQKIIKYIKELRGIYLETLNILKQHDEVLAFCGLADLSDDEKFEIIKAYLEKEQYDKAGEWLRKIDATKWNEMVYYLHAIYLKHKGHDDEAKEELEICIRINDKFVDAYIFLAALVYEDDVMKALDLLKKAERNDANHPKIYLLKAEIYKSNENSLEVVKNIEKYLSLSKDYNNCQVLLDLAINQYYSDNKFYSGYFHRWDKAFRKNKKTNRDEGILVIYTHKDIIDIFMIYSTEHGLDVLLNGNEICSLAGKVKVRSYCGIMTNPLIQMYQDAMINNGTPCEIAEDMRSLCPFFGQHYEDENDYVNVISVLDSTKGILLNHDDGIAKDYMVDDELVSGEVLIYDDKIEGVIIIGGISLGLDINPLLNDADKYYEVLQEDCRFNTCVVEVSFGEKGHKYEINKKRLVYKRYRS